MEGFGVWSVVGYVGAGIGVLIGAIGLLMLLTLMIAGMPNSSSGQLRRMTRATWAIAGGGLGLIGLAVWAMVSGRPGLGAALGASPLAAMVGLIAWVERGRKR